MKKAIIVTSAIEVDNNYPLTYSQTRSFFGTEERFRQTASTVASLDQASDDDTTIFVIDISDNYLNYGALLSYQPNLVFVGVKEKMPHIYQSVRTHPNKSYCEQLILQTFLETYSDVLNNYDFFFKFSGRYFVDRNFDMDQFTAETKPGFYFKPPMKFTWNDNWGYEMVDRRSIQGDNNLYQYCSVLYGWHKDYMSRYIDIAKIIVEYCSSSSGMKYDVETLLYFFTRDYEDVITEMPWIIYGWDGTSGRFLRY